MRIKFFCDNHCSDFEKDELELIESGQHFTHCAFCGQILHILNLDEIVMKSLEEQAEENINKWFKEIGGDETLSLIQRNKEIMGEKVYQNYKRELEKRGFIIK